LSGVPILLSKFCVVSSQS